VNGTNSKRLLECLVALLIIFAAQFASEVAAADRLVALYSAHAVPYAMPWVAEELGLLKKYDLDLDFVYIPSSSTATAAILGGNVEIGLLGGVGIVNAYVSGATDLVFIGSIKNVMTQSVLAKPEITKLEQLKGKRIGVTRIGSNTHYFTVQAFRRAGMNPERDITFIQTGGEAETVGALMAGRIDAATLLPPSDGKAIALGFRYVVFGPDNGISYAASTIATRRSVIAKRGPVIGKFMRVMAESSRILHTDKNLVYKVLGKYLRITDTKVLDAAYQSEVPALERRLDIADAALQASLDEIAPVDPRAKSIKPQDMIDRRYLVELEKSGVFEK
jgi:ABC-type nitrate/sulfonate/bicarbonate transport system substrate-binding protein